MLDESDALASTLPQRIKPPTCSYTHQYQKHDAAAAFAKRSLAPTLEHIEESNTSQEDD